MLWQKGTTHKCSCTLCNIKADLGSIKSIWFNKTDLIKSWNGSMTPQKIDKKQKVSIQVSLRGLRRLTGVDTFCNCIKTPFSQNMAHINSPLQHTSVLPSEYNVSSSLCCKRYSRQGPYIPPSTSWSSCCKITNICSR